MNATENLYTPLRIRTYSGKYVDVTSMVPEDVVPVDIAIGLSRICRFGGHTKRYYSVAEHSVWCANKAAEIYPGDHALKFRCLLHDAHEAYLGDWVTPLVDSIDSLYPGVKDAINVTKRLVQSAINTKFGIGLNPMDCEKVKRIDKLALEYEFEDRVLAWRGLAQPEVVSADVWMHYFKQFVKTPVVIA